MNAQTHSSLKSMPTKPSLNLQGCAVYTAGPLLGSEPTRTHVQSTCVAKTSSDSVSQADLGLDSASAAQVGGMTGLWHGTWPQSSDVSEIKRTRRGGDLGSVGRKFQDGSALQWT